MAQSQNSAGGGIGCLTVLGLIFITLKLTGNIVWSWWWVLAPFWIPLAIVLAVIAFAMLIASIASLND